MVIFLLSIFILAESYPCSLPVVLEPVTLFCERSPVVSLLILLVFFTFIFHCACLLPLKSHQGNNGWVRKTLLAFEVPEQVKVHSIPEFFPKKKKRKCSV